MIKQTTSLALSRRGKNLNISSENTKTELPAGQSLEDEEREPISPAIPAGEEQSSTRKRGVTPETSGNPRPLGRGGGQIFIKSDCKRMARALK